MDTKQFPEKWAVRGSQEFAEFLKRCNTINNKQNWFGADDIRLYYLDHDTGILHFSNYKLPDGYTEVPLEDLIAHYESAHPKWMPLTSKDEVIEEIIEFHNHYIVKIQMLGVPIIYDKNGISINAPYAGSLIPCNQRIAELEQEIESKRSELEKLEGELKELKK